MTKTLLNAFRAEPYRLLFPMGIATAVIGIGIWIPYYFWPEAISYPGQAHASIQIQGFLLCFIFGFLTTMLPKILGVEPLDPSSFLAFPILVIGITLAALANAPLLAQIFHVLVLLNFIFFVARRFPKRRSNPPPTFLFIGVAMFVDLLGTLIKIVVLSEIFLTSVAGQALRLGSLLQFQAFPLLLILGVGSFLLPKLFSNGPIDPQALRGQTGRGIGIPLILCFLFLAGFGIEALGIFIQNGNLYLQMGYALRASVWLWFIFIEIRVHKIPGKLQPYLSAARISMIVMAVAMLMPVFRPQYLIAWEHVLFLSGFMRLTLSIASRVLAAHAGRLEILGLHGRKVRIYGMLIVLSMMTRVLTEIYPGGRLMHLAIAAFLALTALYIWGKIYAPLVKTFPSR